MSPLRRLLLDVERLIYDATDRASRLFDSEDHLRHDRDTLLAEERADPAWDAT